MPLTVRLDDTLAAALERHCAATGATKSLVVQESLAAYLLAQQPAAEAARSTPSRNFVAFQNAGLVGAIDGDGQSATKTVVRQRMAERLRKTRTG